MKTISSIFLTLAMIFVAGIAVAQPGGGRNQNPEEMAARQTEHMTTSLGLSADQAAAVQEINLKFAQQRADARANSQGDQEAMRETMQGMRADHNAELQAVLTEAQYTQFTEMQAQRGQGGPKGGQGGKRKQKPAN